MSFLISKYRVPSKSKIIHTIPRVLVPLAILLTTYLYLYPIFLGCVFPSINHSFETALRDTVVQHDSIHRNPLDTRPHLAPFRLLVLADPQLEGDSSLPDPEDAFDSKVKKHWSRLRRLTWQDATHWSDTLQEVVVELFSEDIPVALRAARKRIDLFGNDYYLAHIFRTLHWWTKPTHVTVLGDLIGSQWVDDEEFELRGLRFWERVFAGTNKVGDDLMEAAVQGAGILVQMDAPSWSTKILNIAGNHDIGYAGDITRERMERFEKKYGKANWDVRFEYPASRVPQNSSSETPKLHLVVFNSMLLDTPVMDETLQTETYTYLNDIISNRVRPVEDRHDFTLLLTHVPLHKKEGICVDAPMFDFWDEEDCTADDCKPGALKEQNHLSEFASQHGILQSMFGMGGNLDLPAQGRGRPGLILTGHDHEGCDTWHYIPSNSTFRGSERGEDEDEKTTTWEATKWSQADTSNPHTGIREVTLRSMMGEFGGNAGLLSAWFDFEAGEWAYDIQMCKFGVQHIWWAVHIIDLVAIGSLLLSGLLTIWPGSTAAVIKKRPGDKSMKIE